MADTHENPYFKVGPKGVPGPGSKELSRLIQLQDLACLEK